MLSPELRKYIETIAARDQIPAENLMAVVTVESAGIVSWTVKGKEVPAARPERHYFYRILQGAERDRAVREGLASPAMGTLASGREAVYAVIDRMRAINDTAAIESTSWGLGQVMGDHWRRLGYKSAQDLYEENAKSPAGQVECMMRFIKADARCLQAIRTGNFAMFASIYNGPGYKMNNYDVQMATWAARYRPLVGKPASDPVVKKAASEEVRRIQNVFIALKYFTGSADGIDDTRLADAIKKFQNDNGLVPDGLYGPFTAKLAEQKVAKQNQKSADNKIKQGLGSATITQAASELTNAGAQIAGFGEIPYLRYITLGIAATLLLLTAYGFYIKFFKEQPVEDE